MVLETKIAEETKMYFKIHPDNVKDLKNMLCNLKSRWKAYRVSERFFQENEKWPKQGKSTWIASS